MNLQICVKHHHALSSPPISDNRTGLVYRNKYCAQCHGVPEKEQISWPSEWRCDYNLMNTAHSNDSILDLDDFLADVVGAGILLAYQLGSFCTYNLESKYKKLENGMFMRTRNY